MSNVTRTKFTWRSATLVSTIVAAACALLVLAGCGGQSAPTTTSTASEEATSQGEQPAFAYSYTKISIASEDYSSITTATYDEAGRLLTITNDDTSSDATYKADSKLGDWDEYGHYTTGTSTQEYSSADTVVLDCKAQNLELDENGVVTSAEYVYTTNTTADDLGDDETAVITITEASEYYDDAQFIKLYERTTEYTNKSGATLSRQTTKLEFDEDGLQTGWTETRTLEDGTEEAATGTITWTKDEDGKPVSFELVMGGENEQPVAFTGDVTVDESGLISGISNFKANGESTDLTVSLEYSRVENPLPNVYEGWKSVPITDFILR